MRRQVRDAGEGDARVVVHDRFIEDDEIQMFMSASDCVVLPYRDLLTSGALVLAMSFGRGCLVPDHPSMTEVMSPACGLVYPGDEGGLEQGLRDALSSAERLAGMGESALERSRGWSWGEIASETAEVYRGAIERASVGARRRAWS